jgi:polar amino acid transport system permease protein
MAQLSPYVGILLQGAVVTLQLAALSLLFASLLGVVVGMVATARFRLARAFAMLYVEAIRSVPLLVQLFFVYYALPLLANVSPSPYQAATLSLSVYGGAYMAEAVRSGILSVGKDQWMAARALGIRYRPTMFYIVAPQALRVTIPAAVGIFIDMLKGASVTSIIGYVELMQTAVNIRNTIYALSPLVAAGVLYFVMCFSFSKASAGIERLLRYESR